MQSHQVSGVSAPETRRAVDIGCNCRNKNKGTSTTAARVAVKLPGGLKVTKANMAEATKFVAQHPGAKIVK